MLEKKDIELDEKVTLIFEYLKELEQTKQEETDFKERKRIGFKTNTAQRLNGCPPASLPCFAVAATQRRRRGVIFIYTNIYVYSIIPPLGGSREAGGGLCDLPTLRSGSSLRFDLRLLDFKKA